MSSPTSAHHDDGVFVQYWQDNDSNQSNGKSRQVQIHAQERTCYVVGGLERSVKEGEVIFKHDRGSEAPQRRWRGLQRVAGE